MECGRIANGQGERELETPLLDVRGLETRFETRDGAVMAVRGVSFTVNRGETVGIVGESGCGKSVTALSLMRLVPNPPGRITAGAVLLDGQDLLSVHEREMRRLRGGRMAMIFQDPFSSLNPTMSLGEQVVEAIRAHSRVPRREARERAVELLQAVHMPAPAMRMRQYPHQVSGGQRQRAMIAMAISTHPDLLIADEPTTALDVTVQAQIMALLADIQRRTGTAILLITHDLGVVAEMCDRVLVMYAGEIVEEGTAEEVFRNARHPYTMGLLASLPQLNAERARRLPAIPGQPPDLTALGPGCPFVDRCARAMDVCRSDPAPWSRASRSHGARCHLYTPADVSVPGR